MQNDTLTLAQELIACRSPHSIGCRLPGNPYPAAWEKSAFRIEKVRCGKVDNLWARRGTSAPLICFAGHTDVVPTGPLEQWKSDPFKPEVRDSTAVWAWSRGYERVACRFRYRDRSVCSRTPQPFGFHCTADHVR